MQPLPTLSHTVGTKTFSIKVPDEWVDSSSIVWAAKPSANQPLAPNVVIQQHPMPKQSMSSFISEQMKELLITNSTLEIEHRADIKWHGFDATELHISWEQNDSYLRQRHLYIQTSTTELLLICFTSSDVDFATYLPFFNEIEQSFASK